MTGWSRLLPVLLLLAGCGVPVQSAPVPVEPEAVPSQLRDSSGPTSRPTPGESGTRTVRVYFVTNDRLIGLDREVRTEPPAEQLGTIVATLLAGPTEAELRRGVASAIPPSLQLTVTGIEGRRAVIELTGQTDGQSATENVLAVGQIVLSATSLPGVSEVSFTRDGGPVETLLADGALTTKPLTAADYTALRLP